MGLEGLEAFLVALDFAVDALFVDGEEGEFFGIAPEGAGLGEGGVDLGVVGVDIGVGGGVAEGDDVVFDGAGAVETPFVFGDGLGDLDFEGAFGVVGEAVSSLCVGFYAFPSVFARARGPRQFRRFRALWAETPMFMWFGVDLTTFKMRQNAALFAS